MTVHMKNKAHNALSLSASNSVCETFFLFPRLSFMQCCFEILYLPGEWQNSPASLPPQGYTAPDGCQWRPCPVHVAELELHILYKSPLCFAAVSRGMCMKGLVFDGYTVRNVWRL